MDFGGSTPLWILSGEQCVYLLSSATPSLEIGTTKLNVWYGFNLERGAFSCYSDQIQSAHVECSGSTELWIRFECSGSIPNPEHLPFPNTRMISAGHTHPPARSFIVTMSNPEFSTGAVLRYGGVSTFYGCQIVFLRYPKRRRVARSPNCSWIATESPVRICHPRVSLLLRCGFGNVGCVTC